MSKKKNISVSIVIPTFNSARTLQKVLDSIFIQEYPKKLLEIIAVDGGSKDQTLKILKKYPVKIVLVSPKKQNAEYNKSIGIHKAKNEILLLIDHDNVLPHKKWIQNIIFPFTQHEEIVGVEPLRFHYDRKMTLLDRYFALLGGTDPVAYYLHKDSHLSWAFDKYNLFGKVKEFSKYYLVTFSADKVPAIGANGAAIRRKLLLKEISSNPNVFFHIDVQVDLIKKGFNKYVLIKDSIIHLTNNKLVPFLQRRKYFVEKYYFNDLSKRRYAIYQGKKDFLLLIYYIFISLTFIKPLFDAMRGYIKIRDKAWFVHPIMCFAMVFVYGIPTVKEGMRNVFMEG